MEQVKEILIKYIENIANQQQYDFVYEMDADENVYGHIVFRDIDGAVLATILTLEITNSEIIQYHQKGEFKRDEIILENQNSLLKILLSIETYLKTNR